MYLKPYQLVALLFSLVLLVCVVFFYHNGASDFVRYLYLAILINLILIFFKKVTNLFTNEETFSNYGELHFYLFKALIGYLVLAKAGTEINYHISAPISFLAILSPTLLHYITSPFVISLSLFLLYVSTVLFVLGIKKRITSTLMLFGFIFISTLQNSMGKIGHGSHLLGLIVIGLCAAVFLSNNRTSYKLTSYQFSFLAIGLFYFFGGLSKVTTASGLPKIWPTTYSLPIWISHKNLEYLSAYGVDSLNIFQTIILNYPMFSIFLLVGVLLLEFLPIVGYGIKSLRPIALMGVVLLHTGNQILLHIGFMSNVVICLFLIYDWPSLINQVLKLVPIRLSTSK